LKEGVGHEAGWHRREKTLREAQTELERRREAAKREAREKYSDKLNEIKMQLTAGHYDIAREMAMELSDTMVFSEIIELFKSKPQYFVCNICSNKIEGVGFNHNNLTWRNPRLCDVCQAKEEKEEQERKKRSFTEFVDRNMQQILKAVGVEGLLMKASYDNFPNEVVQVCRRAQSGKQGIYVHGDVGRGKSWLAAALLKELIKTTRLHEDIARRVVNDVTVFRDLYRFIYVPGLLSEIKSSYDENIGRTEQAVIDEYSNISVLVLDDIGAERPTEWVREKLNTIIYFRNNKYLKTIYTSNINPDGLQSRLDERISSRIQQMCEVIELKGPDRRKK
jgi:DNA replication protein DnaC